MPQALITIALLALAFGLLRFSWVPHTTYLHTTNPKQSSNPWGSALAFWILIEMAGWLVLGLAIFRIISPHAL